MRAGSGAAKTRRTPGVAAPASVGTSANGTAGTRATAAGVSVLRATGSEKVRAISGGASLTDTSERRGADVSGGPAVPVASMSSTA